MELSKYEKAAKDMLVIKHFMEQENYLLALNVSLELNNMLMDEIAKEDDKK